MIRFDKVSKCYRLRREKRGSMKRDFLRMLLNRPRISEHWALRDITLEVPRGTSLALVGPNGSGKTTLLRLVAGATRPTSGSLRVEGRVGGLVDLLAGFHDDLTGIENIFLNATLMGLPRAEIRRRLDTILDFAELGRFIHMPVRHYSWGMLLRLGFAVAVHTDPDILLVDEALAVGDGYFQWKCLRRIADLKRDGVTVLFVSHMPDLSESVCEQSVWLEAGRIRDMGPTSRIVEQYNREIFDRLYAGEPEKWLPGLSALVPTARVGSGEVIIRAVRFLDAAGEPCHAFERLAPMTVEIEALARGPQRGVCVGYVIERQGQSVTVVHSNERGAVFDLPDGVSRIRVVFPALHLYAGPYYFSVSLYRDTSLEDIFDCHVHIYTFTVTDPEPARYSGRILQLPVHIEWQVGDRASSG